VVAGARQALRVISADGRAHAARVLDSSRRLDLALLEVAGADLVPAPIGRSARLRVGQLVFAVGHPWGQPWVVTAGVVSGLGALPPDRAGLGAYIRSDVRLAPGNSGGPLLDAHGEVVGLNAMVIGGDLAIAIPSDVVRRWLGAGP
jgi:serine protease Do